MLYSVVKKTITQSYTSPAFKTKKGSIWSNDRELLRVNGYPFDGIRDRTTYGYKEYNR